MTLGGRSRRSCSISSPLSGLACGKVLAFPQLQAVLGSAMALN